MNTVSLQKAGITLSKMHPSKNRKNPSRNPPPLEFEDAPHQISESYTPDKTAIEILKQIDKQISYESELARVLKLEAKHIRNSLKQLEEHGYIRLQRPTDRAPYYQLTQEGVELLHKPVRTIPFPSGHDLLDEAKIKILQLLADPNCQPFENWMAVALQLHPTRLQVHLSELSQHGYVTIDSFDLWHESTFRLTSKAKKFLVERDLIP